MTNNVMSEYLEIVKRYISKYMKRILGYKYNKMICEALTERYINTRYYNYFSIQEEGLTLRQKIMSELKKLEIKLIGQYPDMEKEINISSIFFYYIMYFDNIILTKNIEKKIENIEKLREKLLNKKEEYFKNELYEIISNWNKEKIEEFDKFESKEFELKITHYKDKKDVNNVKLIHNIKFPYVFSDFAIQKVFSSGIINEDKLYIEYYLISIKIIKDILRHNFKKQYIVEFADSLLEKNKKIKGILNIINSPEIQEKLSLKIKYEKYLKFKEEVHELLRSGFKIAIVLDDSFEIEYSNIEKLSIFSYVLVNKNFKEYNELMKNKNLVNNLIEI